MLRRCYSTLPPTTDALIKVGQIKLCDKHPGADKLYVSQIDVGAKELVQVCSGLVNFIPIEEMQGRRVCLVSNLKPSKMRGVKSSAMVLAADENGTKVELVNPPPSSELGERLFFGETASNEVPSRLKPKVWEAIQAQLGTNEKGEVVFDGAKLQNKLGEAAVVDTLVNCPVR